MGDEVIPVCGCPEPWPRNPMRGEARVGITSVENVKVKLRRLGAQGGGGGQCRPDCHVRPQDQSKGTC
jgi:hypothetical protein